MTAKRNSNRQDFGWRLRSPLLAALLLASGVAALMLAPSVATARPPSRRAPAIAHASSDCDGDGDPEDALDPLECGGNLQKPEPGKLYSKGEKHKFEESALEIRRGEGKICGTTGASFATRAALLTIFTLGGEFHFIALCNALNKLAQEIETLAQDPPDPNVFTVALPRRPKPARAHTAVGRRYLTALSQTDAFGAALGTSLNRLSSTPAQPEEVTALPVPKYSRRLQVGASRLYSGLMAAWGERQSSARAAGLAFVRRHRGAAASKAVAAVLPKSAGTKSLWRAFKSLTAPEYAQLTADLYQQVIEDPILKDVEGIAAKAQTSPAQAQEEYEALQPEALQPARESFEASQKAMFADLGALLDASETPGGNLVPAAKAAIGEAAKLPRIHGLSKYAPQAGLVGRLVSFGAGAFLPGKPKPFPAG